MGIIELIPEISKNWSKQKKAQVEKFVSSASMANMETYNLLKEREIELTGPEQFIICTLDPRTMLQALLLEEKMDLLETIKKNPSILRNKVVSIMKRMAQCDAANINYRDEQTNEVASFILDGREFNKKIKPMVEKVIATPQEEEIKDEMDSPVVSDVEEAIVTPQEQEEVKEDNVVAITDATGGNEEKLNQVKEYATYLLPVFGYNSDNDYMSVMKELDSANLSLSAEDILLEAFAKVFNVPESNLDMLRTQIKTVIELNAPSEEKEMKRVVGL